MRTSALILGCLALLGGLLSVTPLSLAEETAPVSAPALSEKAKPSGTKPLQAGKEKRLEDSSKHMAMREKFRAIHQKRREEMRARMKARHEEMKRNRPQPVSKALATPPAPEHPEHPEHTKPSAAVSK